ncbi:MAG: methylated-DNA--[protein]-cysteine S-methyltransferase [Propionibacteriaceae bacterium]|nr:methylated-DNA--[protein]-cysteine S-methyltransferase [Propionibacteriaceae bacterium]
MIAYASTFDTRDGPFSIISDSNSVLASGWTSDLAALIALIHPSLRPASVSHDPAELLMFARDAVLAYYDGRLDAPSTIPVHQFGATFHLRVWEELRRISPGNRITYAKLSATAGNLRASRSAGHACAMNAAALFVPCHRVVRSDGTLGGFRYGAVIKGNLLEMEALE